MVSGGRVRAIVLAAGKGTRMRSALAKVLHDVCGRPMLWHVLRTLADVGVSDVAVVVNRDVLPHLESLAADARRRARETDETVGRTIAVVQEPQLGTGHAASVALDALEPREGGRVLILNGDMPLVDSDVVQKLVAASQPLALVTAHMPPPSAFGRIVREGGRIARIVEVRDAGPAELALTEMNAGMYAFDEAKLRRTISTLRAANAQGEYYLTDAVGAFVASGEIVTSVAAADHRTLLGVNDRVELAAAAAELRRRLCERHMLAGVTIVDPATTYLEPDLEIAADVTIFPNTSLAAHSCIGAHSEVGPNVRLRNARLGEHVTIADSVAVDATIGDFSSIGPYAHVRGDSIIGTGGRIGNFVEINRSELAAGVKAAHLAYLGDTNAGERTNVGAGTITCNFDGVRKNRTTLGKDVFIGSNSSLVAPLEIGDGAATGAGTVVIRDVPSGARVVGNPARTLPDCTAEPP